MRTVTFLKIFLTNVYFAIHPLKNHDSWYLEGEYKAEMHVDVNEADSECGRVSYKPSYM